MSVQCGVGTRIAAAALGAVIIAGGVGVPAQGTEVYPVEPPTSNAAVGAMSVISWHTSPSLVKLRSEINSRWPNRSKVSDGTIGDTRHTKSRNSHNPVGTSYGPRYGTRGAVHALDITASGINVDKVLNAVIGDSRVWYVIHRGKIWSRTYGWAARTQYGDPHNSHIHINLREDSQSAAVAAEKNTGSWFSGQATTAPAGSTSSLSKAQVVTLQKALIKRGFAIPAGPTGFYGSQTTQAVAAYQRSQGWRGSDADGIAGPTTLKRLGVTGVTAVPASRVTTKKPASTGSGAAAGLSKAKTKKLQKALIKRGFAIPAGATGYYGAQTKRAVAAYQRSQGWRGSDADGIAGPTTLKRLGVTKASTTAKKATSPKSTTGTTKWNAAKKKVVRKVQRALIKKGYGIPAGATGYFGKQTKKAVKRFQKAQGWRGAGADGIPGPQTLKRLGL